MTPTKPCSGSLGSKPSKPSQAVDVLVVIGLSVVYLFICVGWALVHEARPALFWPPAAFGLAFVVWFGRLAWPAIVLCPVLACTIAGYPEILGLGIGLGRLAGAVAGRSILLARGHRPAFDRLEDVLRLIPAAVAVATISSIVYGLVSATAEWASLKFLDLELLYWWAGNTTAILLLTPLLLVPKLRLKGGASHSANVLAWVGLSGSVAALAFAIAPGVPRLLSAVACLPMMVAAAVRYGPRGSAVANVFAGMIAVILTLNGVHQDEGLVLMSLLAVVAVTILCLGALTAERDVALELLQADITARKLAEEEREAAENRRSLAERERDAERVRFAALLEHSQDMILVLSPDGHIAFASEAIVTLTGRTPAEVVGRSCFENIHPDDEARVRLGLSECLTRPGNKTRAEFRVRTKDGRWIWLEALGTNRLDDPAIAGVVINVRDVTERRQFENQLRSARELLEMTGRLTRIGGWEYIVPEDRLNWSEQTYRIHEVNPFETKPTVAQAIEFYAPEARETIRAAVEDGLTKGQSWDLVLPLITAKGRRLWVNAIGKVEYRDNKPYRLYGTIQDVTERVESERAMRQLEEQFRQAQKMEAVARLAGGVAHDFNNLLTVINGFSEILAGEVPEGSVSRELLTHIQEAGSRAAALTRKLLAFGNRQPTTPQPVDLVTIITGLRPLLDPLLGERVQLVLQLEPVPKISADPSQIEQVVMNLCVNGRDAMPEGGKLTVATRLVELSEADSRATPELAPAGRWVVLSVEDTGEGIPEEVQPHLFEPFFTTKEQGKGTGLGLSTVYGITKSAGGHIRFRTARSVGTVFHVYFPPFESAPDGSALEDTGSDDAVAVPLNGTERTDRNDPVLLLVEDEPALRKLSTQVLEGAGFRVIAASDGDEALEKLKTLTRGPEVLVTDVMMPKMTGRELAMLVKDLHPRTRVLFVSGFSPEGLIPAGEAFLHKPFTVKQLLSAVRALVDQQYA
jgi:PAS domain S-box-containing protein